MTKFINSTDIYTTDKSNCPEKRLFVAVLSQAVHDAFSDHVGAIEKRAARGFLKSDSEDFKLICELAGRNSDYVKEKIRKMVLRENGWNVDVKIRISSPRRKKQMRNINKKHLTGNAYYAAKKLQQTSAIH